MLRASPSLKFSPHFEEEEKINSDDNLILMKAGLKDSAKVHAVYNGRRSARRPGRRPERGRFSGGLNTRVRSIASREHVRSIIQRK